MSISPFLGLLCIISSGCSTDTYRHWADADVQKMLHEDKQQTLGYQPVTVIDDPSPKMPAPDRGWLRSPRRRSFPRSRRPLSRSKVTCRMARSAPSSNGCAIGPLATICTRSRRSPLSSVEPPIACARPAVAVRTSTPARSVQIAMGYGIQHSRQYQDQAGNPLRNRIDRHVAASPAARA